MAKHDYLKTRKKDAKLAKKVEPKRHDQDECELFRVQGELLERLNRKVNRYGDRLGNHEMRIREIENFFNVQYLGDDPEDDPEVRAEVEAEEAEVEAETEAEVEVSEEPVEEPKEPKVEGYTGPQLVFFIHGENGKIDYGRPFYNCLVAKGFDPNYKVVPSLVKNGRFVRSLTKEEYTTYEW